MIAPTEVAGVRVEDVVSLLSVLQEERPDLPPLEALRDLRGDRDRWRKDYAAAITCMDAATSRAASAEIALAEVREGTRQACAQTICAGCRDGWTLAVDPADASEWIHRRPDGRLDPCEASVIWRCPVCAGEGRRP